MGKGTGDRFANPYPAPPTDYFIYFTGYWLVTVSGFPVGVYEVQPMSRIAVLLTDMFQDVEYEKPADAFRKAGHELTLVGLRAGVPVTGEHGMTVRIDRAVHDVRVSDFDALFIPGGYSPDKLRIDEQAVRFAKEFVESGRPVFGICHAAQLLITAQVLKGKKTLPAGSQLFRILKMPEPNTLRQTLLWIETWSPAGNPRIFRRFQRRRLKC